ncbi:MAG: hypothetical protein KDE53_36405, partial [Caldilineaceae bacterium]|nr:hypothetical protein [Caldilineaceae bacterium]
MRNHRTRAAGPYAFLVVLLLTTGCNITAHVRHPTGADHAMAKNVQLVGRFGGPLLSVAVQGNYAYAGFSFEFAVVDIGDPAQPRRVGYLPLATNAIALSEELAYVGGRDGLSVVAINDPFQPKILGWLATAAAVTDVAQAGSIVYLLDGINGLSIVDVRHPTLPQRLSTLLVSTQPEGLAVAGNHLYVATYEGLFVIDVADPHHP